MKAQRIEKKTTEDQSELQRLYKAATAAAKRLKAFEEEHEEELDVYKHLQETLSGIQEQLKVEARKFSKLGVSRTLIDSDDIFVSVQGREQRVLHADKAKKIFSAEVLKLALKEIVDPKVVDGLVETGQLSEGDVSRVSSFTPLTPAVTIRFP